MSDESKLCARLIVAKQPPAMRNLSVQWVDGLRGSVTKRRDTAAKFLAQLKNQSGDYADAHRALIAECDKMLAASEMNEALGVALEDFVDLLEYWNGNNGAAVDACQHTLEISERAIHRIGAVLQKINPNLEDDPTDLRGPGDD